jgi:hypothetical protein
LQSASSRTLSALRPAGELIGRGTLATLDLAHQTILRKKQGERARARTARIRFAPELRRRISARQSNLCMYCGVRLNRTNLQVDHVYPVEFGGPNEESNLQALCGRCNARKGVQTDADFRARYSEALGSLQVGRPPQRRIPYERFAAITRKTNQGHTTRALRRAVFRTPKQKIASGSLVLGGITGGAWFIVVALLLPQSEAGQFLAFFGGIALGVSTWLGSVWRAKYTEIWDREE